MTSKTRCSKIGESRVAILVEQELAKAQIGMYYTSIVDELDSFDDLARQAESKSIYDLIFLDVVFQSAISGPFNVDVLHVGPYRNPLCDAIVVSKKSVDSCFIVYGLNVVWIMISGNLSDAVGPDAMDKSEDPRGNYSNQRWLLPQACWMM